MGKRKVVKDVIGKPKQKMLFSIIYQVPFDADTALYDTKDPKEMAAVDEKEANKTPFEAFRSMATLPGGKFRVKVSHVESTADKTGLKVK